MVNRKERIEIIDALRGLAVILMVAHHLLYNCVEFLGGPYWLYSNPVFDVLHYIFAGLFIFLSGVSSRFSRGNIKRGLIAIALAAVISIVTYLIEMPIWFGVLHLLGFLMLLFGLTRKLWDFIPRLVAPFLFISLTAAGALILKYVDITAENPVLRVLLSILGWRQKGFVSYDYFPILPWIFVFLLGTWTGLYIKERKLPEWFYKAKFPVFPAVGRKSLMIYVLHQPILYGLTMGIKYILPP